MRADARVLPRPGRAPLVDVRVDLEGRDYGDMATVTEDALRQLMSANGWRTHTVPGHRSNSGGPDLVAYRIDPATKRFALRILDNKATHPLTTRPGRAITAASGLSAMSLSRNLYPIVRRLSTSTDPLDRQAVAALNSVRAAAVTAARAAARTKVTDAAKRRARRDALIRLPKGSDIRIAVTNVGGRSTAVAGRLAKRGVHFVPWWQLEVAP